MILSCLIQR